MPTAETGPGEQSSRGGPRLPHTLSRLVPGNTVSAPRCAEGSRAEQPRGAMVLPNTSYCTVLRATTPPRDVPTAETGPGEQSSRGGPRFCPTLPLVQCCALLSPPRDVPIASKRANETSTAQHNSAGSIYFISYFMFLTSEGVLQPGRTTFIHTRHDMYAN